MVHASFLESKRNKHWKTRPQTVVAIAWRCRAGICIIRAALGRIVREQTLRGSWKERCIQNVDRSLMGVSYVVSCIGYRLQYSGCFWLLYPVLELIECMPSTNISAGAILFPSLSAVCLFSLRVTRLVSRSELCKSCAIRDWLEHRSIACRSA